MVKYVDPDGPTHVIQYSASDAVVGVHEEVVAKLAEIANELLTGRPSGKY